MFTFFDKRLEGVPVLLRVFAEVSLAIFPTGHFRTMSGRIVLSGFHHRAERHDTTIALELVAAHVKIVQLLN